MFFKIGTLSLKLKDGITPEIICNILQLIYNLEKIGKLSDEALKNILSLCTHSEYIEGHYMIDGASLSLISAKIHQELSILSVLSSYKIEFWVENNQDIFAYPSEWIGKTSNYSNKYPEFIATVNYNRSLESMQKPKSSRTVKKSWLKKLI